MSLHIFINHNYTMIDCNILYIENPLTKLFFENILQNYYKTEHKVNNGNHLE